MNSVFAEQLAILAPAFVLVTARVGGMVFAAPVFGSAAVPVRIRAMIALVLAMGIFPGIARPQHLPDSTAGGFAAIGSEIIFGLTMGLSMRLVFTGVQWAGEMIGQQMGLGLANVF